MCDLRSGKDCRPCSLEKRSAMNRLGHDDFERNANKLRANSSAERARLGKSIPKGSRSTGIQFLELALQILKFSA